MNVLKQYKKHKKLTKIIVQLARKRLFDKSRFFLALEMVFLAILLLFNTFLLMPKLLLVSQEVIFLILDDL